MTTILYPEAAFADLAFERDLLGRTLRSSVGTSDNSPTWTMPIVRARTD